MLQNRDQEDSGGGDGEGEEEETWEEQEEEERNKAVGMEGPTGVDMLSPTRTTEGAEPFPHEKAKSHSGKPVRPTRTQPSKDEASGAMQVSVKLYLKVVIEWP